MNGFLGEVLTQGKLMKEVISFYRGEGRRLIDLVTKEFSEKNMDRIILTGMGSSQYALDCVRGYLTQHNILTVSFSSFELSRFQFNQITPKTLIVAVSQSGNSAEVIELAERASEITSVVGIYNNEECRLRQIVDFHLPIRAGKETSITSKTYQNTMLIANILAKSLTGGLDDVFWKNAEAAAEWCCKWLDNWEKPSQEMYQFVQGVELFDLLANNASLSTARQLSLAYREGLHNCTAVWECADYAHGQYHSAKMGGRYLAQMFFPVFEKDSKEAKMLNFIIDHGGRVILYTKSSVPQRDRLLIVPMPALQETLVPLSESVAAETLLGLLFGSDWVKDH